MPSALWPEARQLPFADPPPPGIGFGSHSAPNPLFFRPPEAHTSPAHTMTQCASVARLSEVVPNVALRDELGDTQGQRPAMTSRPHDLTTIRECFDSTGSLQALTIDPANHPLGCRSSEAIVSALMLVMSSESFLIPQAFASVCSECSFQTRNRRCLLLAIVRSVLCGVASDRVGRVEDAFMRGTRCEKAPTLFVGIARPSCTSG